MSRILTCPLGHRWTVAADEPSAETGRPSVCPVCASPHVTVYALTPDSGDQLTLPPTEVPVISLPPREPVPGYEILEELGRGGMGVVYKARQKSLKRLVALKMILAGAHASADTLVRFRLEAESVARLQHPNIVQIYEVGEHEGLPYFSLEFVDGQGLDKMQDGTPLPPKASAALVETIAHAIQAAHEAGVIHRDLKPANVLLQKTSRKDPGAPREEEGDRSAPLLGDLASSRETLIPKITDFGLARRLDVDSRHTHSGSIMGTPSYMSPEQAEGRRGEIGPATDVYALGALLYELITGRPPFKGASLLETLQMVRSQDPVPPSRLQPRCPRDLETICLTCLQKDRRKRYPSAAALAADLRRFQNGEPILARPTPIWERGIKWARRRPAIAILLSISLIAGIALLGVWAVLTAQLRSERDRANAEAAEAQLQQQIAEASELTARRNLYAAHMNLAERAWQEAQVPRFLELLEEYRHPRPRQSDLRGFEWYYLWQLGHSERLTYRGHKGNVNAVAFNPAAPTEIASAGDDGTVQLWDSRTGRVLGALTQPGEVACLAFSPDGKWLATGSWNRTHVGPVHEVRVWDVGTQRLERTLESHTGGILSVAFSADGKRLATGSLGGTARVWDLRTGEELLALVGHQRPVFAVAFSPDGNRVATASGDRTARVWNAHTGEPIFTLDEHPGAVKALAFSPNGKTLATASGALMRPAEIRLWDASTGAAADILQGHTGPINSLAFTRDGRRLASGSDDRTVRVWEPGAGRPLYSFRGHTGPVRCIAFSSDGLALASASADQSVKMWEGASNPESRVLGLHPGTVWGVAFTPDGKSIVAATSEHAVVVWDAATRKVLRTLRCDIDPVRAIAISPDGKRLLCTGDDPTARVIDLESGGQVQKLAGHSGAIRGVAWSRDGARVATASNDQTVKVWDAATGQEVATLRGHTDRVDAVAFHPRDSGIVATASADETVRVWDVARGEATLTLGQGVTEYTALAFSPGGDRLAATGRNGTATVWETATGTELALLKGHTDAVSSLAFSPDGERLATASDDLTVRVWDAATGQEVLRLVGHSNWVHAVAFSPDGRRLASAGADRTVRLWEAAPQ